MEYGCAIFGYIGHYRKLVFFTSIVLHTCKNFRFFTRSAKCFKLYYSVIWLYAKSLKYFQFKSKISMQQPGMFTKLKVKKG